jgi:hypothetical protein
MEQVSNTDDMKTMSQCVNKLVGDGYTEDFKIDEKGRLFSPSANKSYKADKVHILNFFRFEGASDPDDNAILYAIQTDDGTKGTLTDAYGTYADPNVSKFIKQVEDMSKKNPKPVDVHE